MLDHEIGDVPVRHQPLLAGEVVTAVAPDRRGSHLPRIGAGALLADGEAIAALAAATRQQIAPSLLRRAVLERDGRLPCRTQDAACSIAELFIDEGLLKQVEPLSAMLARVIDGVEAGLQHRPPNVIHDRGRELAMLLDRHLVREELGLREVSRALLERAILR